MASLLRKRHTILFSFITLLIFQSCQSSSPQNWEDEIIYFALIDRFANGDSTNDDLGPEGSFIPYTGDNPASLITYQGGDLKGLTQRINDLASLGITVLWISPFFDNSNTDYVGWWPYHGYHPIDFYNIDEHFGTLEDLKILISTAHDHGLKILFDMPFNQTAPDHPWLNDAKKKDTWYHHDKDGNPFDITDWFNQEQIENGELHGLPDLAQENPDVAQYIYDLSDYWVRETQVDGFRLDAVKHIPISFWEKYNRHMKETFGKDFFLLGEVFWGETERMEPYTNIGFDGLFDFSFYYGVNRSLAKGTGIPTLSQMLKSSLQSLNDINRVTLIDNHDLPRFNSGTALHDWELEKLALGFQLTTPGIPMLYYGTEIGMEGTALHSETRDYLNRLPYPKTLTTLEKSHLHDTQELIHLRQSHPALSIGSFHEIYKDWGVYAFLRHYKDNTFLIVLNSSDMEDFVSFDPKEYLGETVIKRQIYGHATLREMDEGWSFRLPATSLSVWKIKPSHAIDSLSQWIIFTPRIPKAFKRTTLKIVGTDSLDVKIAGDFNNWQPQKYKQHLVGDTLTISFPLKPGRYAYKLVLNDKDWVQDDHNPLFEIDPFGGKNSILVVE